MLFESGKIEDVEFQIYELLFQDTAAEFKLDSAVYIDSSPEVCFTRIAKRARDGESAIPLEYLSDCCRYYNDWLLPLSNDSESTRNTIPVLHLNTNSDATYSESDENDVGNQWIRQVIEFMKTPFGI
jgi:deoxycitidine kinase